MARADIEALVADQVQDTGRLRAGADGRAIDEAVLRYSKDRPLIEVAELTADGTPYLPAPASWRDGSRIVGLEWPVGEDPPATRRPLELTPFQTGTGPALRVTGTRPPAGTAVRLWHTVPHRLTDSEDTIPEGDRFAVAALAASLLLEQLAVATAGDTDSTIPTDTVDHKGASERYAARARAARKVYDDHLAAAGPDPDRPAGGAVHVSLPGRRGLLRSKR